MLLVNPVNPVNIAVLKTQRAQGLAFALRNMLVLTSKLSELTRSLPRLVGVP